MKRQHSIKLKIFASLGIVVATALGGSIYAVLTARHMRATLIQELIEGAKRLDQTREMTISIANMRTAMRGVSIFSIQNHPEQVQKSRAMFESSAADMRVVLQEIERTTLAPEEQAAVNEIRSNGDQWLAGFGQFADLSVSGHGDTATELALKTLTPLIDVLQKRTAELGRAGKERQQKATESALAAMRWSEGLNWALALTVLLAAAGAFAVVAVLIRMLREIAAGIATGAQEVACASAQVSNASESLAQGSSEQAASLEETSAATQEVNSMAQSNTASSNTTAEIVTESADRFEEANRALKQMVVATGEINASSNKISKIIKVIDEIAFQTNILALNAAVEAARAGEAGMGFAVVADEVRNLAQRCAQAARDTAGLIEDSVQKSREGKLKVDEASKAMQANVAIACKIGAQIDEVSLSSQEQTRGLEQIAKAINQMEQVTQTTAANAEENASAAEELSAQSETFKGIVDRLTAMVGGSEAANGHTSQIRYRASAVSSKRPQWQGEPSASPAALGKAQSHQPKSAKPGAPVVTAFASDKDFPLEEQFKEF